MTQDSFQELQSRDQIEELLAVLDTDFPHSLHYSFFIKILQAWKDQDPNIVLQVLVPNPHDLRDGTSLTIFAMTSTSAKIYMMYSLEASCEKLRRALSNTNKIDWSSTHCEWEAIHEKHLPVLREVLESKQCGGDYLPHYQYYMTVEQGLNVELREKSEVQLIDLREEHAPLVDNHWEYQTHETIDYIKGCIQYNFGFGIRQTNQSELIAWIAQTHYGGGGMLYTKENHRKRGYGEMLVRKLTKHLAKSNQVPSVVVGSDNTASIRLNEKIGYRRVCKVYWVVFENH
uniref:Glycine N-acyltransferase-like protein 2 n=2 Tax=Cacopsylla melanoneura TaxID=428564 RepID=A0A8D8LFY7_9HEMI